MTEQDGKLLDETDRTRNRVTLEYYFALVLHLNVDFIENSLFSDKYMQNLF